MATKTTTKKATPAKAAAAKAAAPKPAAKPAARRALNLTRYVEVTGDLAAALKQYQTLLKGIAAGRKIDVKAFDAAVKAMNKAGDNFDKLTEKHEDAVLTYVDQLELE
jgi:hypothetical protein